MVNELNKPPSQENLALGERLLDSQRQLQEMQEEHHQLLQEMEVLRQRAAALSRLNEQQFDHVIVSNTSVASENTTNNETAASDHVDLNEVHQDTPANAASVEITEQTTPLYTDINDAQTETTNPATQPSVSENDEDTEDPETAEYLQEKLAEIAKLKARFKRVQNMMSTTDMIEGHIGSIDKICLPSQVQSPSVSSTTTAQPDGKQNEGETYVEIEQTKYDKTINDDERAIDAYAPSSQTPNEELLSAMMNMFSDFTADLRSQADDLRAERDRLRALKEDLLRRKRQS